MTSMFQNQTENYFWHAFKYDNIFGSVWLNSMLDGLSKSLNTYLYIFQALSRHRIAYAERDGDNVLVNNWVCYALESSIGFRLFFPEVE